MIKNTEVTKEVVNEDLKEFDFEKKPESLKKIDQSPPHIELFDPLVKKRIQETLLYFGGGLAFTGISTGALRNNTKLALASPFVSMVLGFLGIACLGVTLTTDYEKQPILKHASWGGFLLQSSLCLVPLIKKAGIVIAYDALFATGFTMGGLALIAYYSPNENYLLLHGAFAMLLACMNGLCLSIWLWPGRRIFLF